MSISLSRRLNHRRVELIRRFRRQIAKASLYLKSVDCATKGSAQSQSRSRAYYCEESEVELEVRRLDDALVQHERDEFRRAIADLSKTADIATGAEEFMRLMEEAFDILIMPCFAPPRDIFERTTGLRLIPDQGVCNCRESANIGNEYFDVDRGVWVVRL